MVSKVPIRKAETKAGYGKDERTLMTTHPGRDRFRAVSAQELRVMAGRAAAGRQCYLAVQVQPGAWCASCQEAR